MRKMRLTSMFFYGVLISCSPDQPPSEPTLISETDSVSTETSDETERFNIWLDEQWETQLSFSPQSQTSLGLKSNYDKLDDYTLEAQDAEIEWLRASVGIMEDMFDYQNLSEEGMLSWICGMNLFRMLKVLFLLEIISICLEEGVFMLSCQIS